MELTSTQQFTVTLLYLSSLLPAVIIIGLFLAGKVPRWLMATYVGTFLLCALGWELWISYGLVDGLDVVSRRPDVMNAVIPLHINWLLNSLGDAGAVGLSGVLLVWLAYGRTNAAFTQWKWGAFTILLAWFIFQNLFVELYVYQQQLAQGLRISWAPLMPTGSWYNPIVFTFDGRHALLQTQLPWLLMTPLYYCLLLKSYKKWGPKNST
jgi:hypothetical protein